MNEMVIRKYSTRRLYDTEESRYVNLEELAERLRDGRDLKVVDAKSGEDLTRSVLVQLLEQRRVLDLVPTPVLRQLLRSGEREIADVFGNTLAWAVEMQSRGASVRGETHVPYVPSASPRPVEASVPAPVSGPVRPYPRPADEPAAVTPVALPPDPPEAWEDDASAVQSGVRGKSRPADAAEVAALRSELAELKALLLGSKTSVG